VEIRRSCPTCRADYSPKAIFCPKDGTRLVDRLVKTKAPDPLVGSTVAGRYHVERKLGQGGMGAVYWARQLPIDRPVALKVLRPELRADIETSKRFFLEARAASRLENGHAIRIYDYDRTPEGLSYIAMELLEGRDLRALLRADNSLPVAEAVRVFSGICDALAEAHARGIVHRDMKPENVFLARIGPEAAYVKVLDFGLARAPRLSSTKVTKTGFVSGTPAYMAPEVIRGDTADARADVYALGVMLYEMLAGIRPFTGGTAIELMVQHMHDEPVPIDVANPCVDVPPGLQALLWACLAKPVEQRPADAGEVLSALRAVRLDARGPVERLRPLFVTGGVFVAESVATALRDTRRREGPAPRSAGPSPAAPPVAPTAAPAPWWRALTGGKKKDAKGR
jgi:serine/threonine-protein kinase